MSKESSRKIIGLVLLLTLVSGAVITSTTVMTRADAYKKQSLLEDKHFYIDGDNAPTTSLDWADNASTTKEGNSTFNFSNVRKYSGDRGLCDLNDGGTITKVEPSKGLSKIEVYASKTNNSLTITTSDYQDMTQP